MIHVLLPTKKQYIFYTVWLDNRGYLISKREKCERTGCIMVQMFWRTKTLTNTGKFCDKDYILTVQEKRVALIGNNTQIILEMTPRKR